MEGSSVKKVWFIKIGLLLLVITYIFPFFRQILDIDFWWHLATGREIYTKKMLLSFDPFTYTTQIYPSPERMPILNRYWAGQLSFYIFYILGGLKGVVFLRALILILIVTLGGVYLWKKNEVFSVAYVVLAGLVLYDYTGIRPQLYSFLCFTVLVLLIDQVLDIANDEKIGWHYVSGLTLLMLFWANLHPGYILGSVLILIVIVSDALKMYRKRIHLRLILRRVSPLLLPIGFSMLNPVLYKSYISLFTFEGSVLQSRTSEYASPITYLLNGGPYIPGFWLSIPIFLFSTIRGWRRVGMSRVLISGFLFLISLTAFRYVPFFVIGSIILSSIPSEGIYKEKTRKLTSVFCSFVITIMVLYNISFMSNFMQTVKQPVNSQRFPVAAADFMSEHLLPPEVFNHFNWGGYLEWKLYPRYHFFIDSRTLSKRAFRDYTHILWDSKTWRSLIDSYNINTVIIPPKNPSTGEPYALVRFLLSDQNWQLVYNDYIALIFIRPAERRALKEQQ